MKKSKILAATLGLMLLGATAAHADDRDYYEDHEHGGRGHYEASQRAEQDRIAHEQAAREEAIREQQAADIRAKELHAKKVEQIRKARWARGDRFPAEYHTPKYLVSDWNGHHLQKPPKGYRWYRADNQYVLVRTSDNVISNILDALR